MACFIWKRDGGDSLVVQLSALLHDIADWKFHAVMTLHPARQLPNGSQVAG
jgi:HD superfamily phosphodiesterase